MTYKNCLIIGCGSKFGLTLTQTLLDQNCQVYGISGSCLPDHERLSVLKVDWDTCEISDIEKFVRKLPKLDLIIFNQNSAKMQSQMIKLGSLDTLTVWKQSKLWTHSHYVGSVMPIHILNSLHSCNSIDETTITTWLLSNSILSKNTASPIDYKAQKYLNAEIIRYLSLNNAGAFIGLDPGKLTDQNYDSKAQTFIQFCFNATTSTINGKYFTFDIDNNSVIVHDTIC